MDKFKLSDIEDLSDGALFYFIMKSIVLVAVIITAIVCFAKIVKRVSASSLGEKAKTNTSNKNVLYLIALISSIIMMFMMTFKMVDYSFWRYTFDYNGYSFLSNDIMPFIDLLNDEIVTYVFLIALTLVILVFINIGRLYKVIKHYFENDRISVRYLGNSLIVSCLISAIYALLGFALKYVVSELLCEGYGEGSTSAYIPFIIQIVFLIVFSIIKNPSSDEKDISEKEAAYLKEKEAFNALPVGEQLKKMYHDFLKADRDAYKRWVIDPLTKKKQRSTR